MLVVVVDSVSVAGSPVTEGCDEYDIADSDCAEVKEDEYEIVRTRLQTHARMVLIDRSASCQAHGPRFPNTSCVSSM